MADFTDIQIAYFRQGRAAALEAIKRHAVDEADYLGNTLLHEAARQCDAEALSYLLGQHLRAGKTNKAGQTPLFCLTEYRDWEKCPDEMYQCTRLLLDAGCPASRRDEYGFCCYHRAAQQGVFPFIEAFKDMKVACDGVEDSTGDNALHMACAAMDQYRYLLGKPQFDTIEERYLQTIRNLLDAGIDPSDENALHRTPVYYAVEAKATRIAALLNGEDSTDQHVLAAGGMTLFQAASEQNIPALRALIRLGNDVNAVSDDPVYRGLTPLMAACRSICPQSVSVLLESGANPSVQCGEHTALYYLCTALEWGNFPNPRNQASNFLHIFEMLVAGGVDLNQTVDDRGRTALCLLCAKADRPWDTGERTVQQILCEKLLDNHADCNAPDQMGNSPLLALCSAGGSIAEDLLYLLLESGADMKAQNNHGDTAAICAARLSNPATALTLIRVLFDFGFCMPETVNNDGKTALDYAVANDNQPLVKFLLSKI